ncbi:MULTISPECIES: alcohol dehydrogenase catalytic domain-containing protein [Bifidobacterium]|nr:MULTISPECIES: alcohol dehydrogenase catalytic domain-containing protein [Bifidobacterium]
MNGGIIGSPTNEAAGESNNPTTRPAAAPATMHAWQIREQPGPITGDPLEWVEKPVPQPGPGEALIRVLACGVCRTDLHVSEGDLPVHRDHVTPGHEVVGEIVALGPDAGIDVFGNRFEAHIGERVGAAWLRHTCSECEFCHSGKENLCQHSLYNGWDANGGYAEYMVAPIEYLYSLEPLLGGGDGAGSTPYSVQTVAPLLCAGIIGFRALKRTGLLDGISFDGLDLDKAREQIAARLGHKPVLGLYGFGGSAHITAQVALALGMRVHVLTRGKEAQRLALKLGCAFADDAYEMPPEPLDAAIIFAPVGAIVLPALEALRPGGVLSLAGIHMSDVPALNYEKHLFHEKEIRSVESNTRQDGREFLAFAAAHHITIDAHPYPLDQGQQALKDLKAGAFTGAAVLMP